MTTASFSHSATPRRWIDQPAAVAGSRTPMAGAWALFGSIATTGLLMQAVVLMASTAA